MTIDQNSNSNSDERQIATMSVKVGLAQMLKGGVIMDVTLSLIHI